MYCKTLWTCTSRGQSFERESMREAHLALEVWKTIPVIWACPKCVAILLEIFHIP